MNALTKFTVKPAELPLQIGMFLCFSLMGIYWVRVLNLGSLSLEAYHVGLLAIVAMTGLSVYSPWAVVAVVRRCAPWLIAWLGYLLLLVPALAGSQAMSLLLKQILFITGFVCIAAYFYRASDPVTSLRRGAIAGILLYLAFTEYSAQLIGKSIAGAVVEFLSTGSFKALIFGFFRPVFNSLEDGTDLAFVASLTNSIAVSLLVLALCFRAGRRREGVDVVGSAVLLAVLALALLLNARSVVMVGVAAMVLAFVVRLAAARAIALVELFYWSVVAIGLMTALTIIAITSPSAVDSVTEVFRFEDNSAESRLEQYVWAFGLIEDQLLLGHGYIETDKGLPIHNLFLSSWAYTGVLGFLLILVFYFGLLVSWLRWLALTLSRPSSWILGVRPEWVGVLPVLPLFRVWISGAGGMPAYGEWIALGVFVGLVMRNEREKSEGKVLGYGNNLR